MTPTLKPGELCAHPHAQRWQYDGHWMCCVCSRYFWGDKRCTPTTDYCGRPTSAVEVLRGGKEKG